MSLISPEESTRKLIRSIEEKNDDDWSDGEPKEKVVKTTKWKIDLDIPRFRGEDRQYIDKLIFVGEEND